MERFCSLSGCEIPRQVDISKIRSTELVIHAAPQSPGVLIANAVIVNQANFDQPFPNLLLVFEDLQGNPVARRSFKPEEYLYGELTGAVIMPRNQPVKLELQLLDPGPEAINYSLYIDE